MYGRKKYSSRNKFESVPSEAVPTYVCGHCKKVKSAALFLVAEFKSGCLPVW